MSKRNEDLGKLIKNNINKQFSVNDDNIAYSLHDPDNMVNVKSYIGTGSSTLDLAISNKKRGGIPTGRITELTGLEGTGKSLICAHLCASTQKKDGVAIFIDTEMAIDEQFFAAVGVDLGELIVMNLQTVEDIYSGIDSIITTIRKKHPNKLVTIIVDSLTSAISQEVMEDDYSKKGYATQKAIVNSNSLKRFVQKISSQNIALIMTSQMRMKMGFTGFGSKYRSSSGGMALQYYSSVRVILKRIKTLYKQVSGVKTPIGVKIRAKVVKNRVGPPFREADFNVYFDSGIDDYNNWLDIVKKNKLLSKASARTFKVDIDGKEETISFRNWAETLDENEKLRDRIYDKISDVLIMKYKNVTDVDVENIIEVDEDEESDEG